jgi:carbonic anhydrase
MRIIPLTLVTFVTISRLMGADETFPRLSPEEALARLKAGNEHFARAVHSSSKPTHARRLDTAKSQNPFAIIVGCSDSRTSPEMIFEQNIGDLFVVRTAGNLADDIGLGSIEYAVAHLGPRLVVVLGHSRCGAVAAAVDGATAPGHIENIVSQIRPAVELVRAQGGDVLANAIRRNIDLVAKRIKDKAELGSLASSVRVVKAYYDLDSGKVTWLNDSQASR